MPIFQYKCERCNSVFETLVFGHTNEVNCVLCGSEDVNRVFSSFFSPKKEYCPKKDKKCGKCVAKGNCNLGSF